MRRAWGNFPTRSCGHQGHHVPIHACPTFKSVISGHGSNQDSSLFEPGMIAQSPRRGWATSQLDQQSTFLVHGDCCWKASVGFVLTTISIRCASFHATPSIRRLSSIHSLSRMSSRKDRYMLWSHSSDTGNVHQSIFRCGPEVEFASIRAGCRVCCCRLSASVCTCEVPELHPENVECSIPVCSCA